MSSSNMKWGYLRETCQMAEKAGIGYTGLEEYLKVIFPDIDDWIHDKPIGTLNQRRSAWRPDYRSEKLKMIIEFDGLQHYTNPQNILADKLKTEEYQKAGYRVIRIPYFIQLTNQVVKTIFNVDITTPLFDPTVASMSIHWGNTPAFLCPAGIKRMAKEFKQFPEQYIVNSMALKMENNTYLSGIELLEEIYIKINNNTPENITSLEENEIFVFGSNLEGRHYGGAARIAVQNFGAIMGQGVGLQGQCYAIPTMHGGIDAIKPYVDEFISFAKTRRDLKFLVTRIGCGIAGFRPEEIAPLFEDAYKEPNIRLPESFVDIIINEP